MATPSLRDVIDGATTLLAQAGVPSARADALALAEHVLGVRSLVLAMAPAIDSDFTARYAQLVQQRCQRIPLQHLTSRAYFRHLELSVERGVFVPRPETEMVAEHAIAAARAAGGRPLVVDLCTGAGPIACAIAHEVPRAEVIAVDAEPAAVALTARNAERNGVRLTARAGDVCDPQLLPDLDGSVDVVVANPPYIPPDAEPTEPEVRDHDPDLALYGGGGDGLRLPGAVVHCARRLLRSGGVLVMEHAEVQDRAVRELVEATGAFAETRTEPDLTGRPRMVIARAR